MKHNILLSIVVGIAVICVVGLVDSGHRFYVRREAGKYARQGSVYYDGEHYEQAINAFTQSLVIFPHQQQVLITRGNCYYCLKQYDLAWIMASSPDPAVRNGRESLRYAQQAVAATQGTDKQIEYLYTLAAAAARDGDYALAVAKQMEVNSLIEKQDPANRDLPVLRQRLTQYQQGKPFTSNYTPVLN